MTKTLHPLRAAANAVGWVRAGRPRISGYGRINLDDVSAGIEVDIRTPQALGKEAWVTITIPGHVLFDLSGRALHNRTGKSVIGDHGRGGIVAKVERR